LAGVSGLEQANAFLPAFIESYNRRFAHQPREAESAWHSLPEKMEIDYYFLTCEQRQVRRDHTITWLWQLWQLVPEKNDLSLAMKKVEVHVTPEGSLSIYEGQRRVKHCAVGTSVPQPAARVIARHRPVSGREPDPEALFVLSCFRDLISQRRPNALAVGLLQEKFLTL
jgi:hypothetical protein